MTDPLQARRDQASTSVSDPLATYKMTLRTEGEIFEVPLQDGVKVWVIRDWNGNRLKDGMYVVVERMHTSFTKEPDVGPEEDNDEGEEEDEFEENDGNDVRFIRAEPLLALTSCDGGRAVVGTTRLIDIFTVLLATTPWEAVVV
ncbi:hypothetical protein Bbelb_374590 [Branchiostoma belcheri]|nr:hypothetical protein Bbelb_374590 [Branchiostoma belcheri]